MQTKEEEATRELRARLTKVLRGLLRPIKLKNLVITKADRYAVRGILLIVCPIEKVESGRDFEVRLAGNHGDAIKYVSVDGRRLLPRRRRKTVSRPGGSRPFADR